MFADSDLFYFSSLIFKNITISLKKSNSSEKNVIVGEELDCIGIDDIGNLEDSPSLVFISEECGNLIEVIDGGELTENISSKKADILQQPIDVYLVTNAVDESISSVTCGIFTE